MSRRIALLMAVAVPCVLGLTGCRGDERAAATAPPAVAGPSGGSGPRGAAGADPLGDVEAGVDAIVRDLDADADADADADTAAGADGGR